LILEAHGPTLPQLFENAARQLLALLTDPQEVGQVLREKIVAEAPDTPALLRQWIAALLELARTQKILFQSYRFQEFKTDAGEPFSLRAEGVGEWMDPGRHVLRRTPDIRCRRADVSQNAEGYHAAIELEMP